MVLEIRRADSAEDFDEVRRQYRGFSDWMTETYQDVNYLLDDFYAAVEADGASLPGDYAPPGGCLLLAWVDDSAAGTVALQDLDGGSCEMKRMFVGGEFQGQGIGRALVESLLNKASHMGYGRMILETGPRQLAAQRLYARMGFQEIEPYNDSSIPEDVFSQLPEDIQRGIKFMEYKL